MSRLSRAARLAAASVIALTAIGTLTAIIDPTLGPSTRPHPTLTPDLTTALSLWQNNARVLAAPFILTALHFADSRIGRTIGDLIIAALAGYSTITVGLALGRWRGALIPYIPNLPAEWAALTLSVTTWLLIRSQRSTRRQLITLAICIAVLLTSAAVLETWATPSRTEHPDRNTATGQLPSAKTPEALMRGRRSDGVSLILPAQSAGGSLSHHQTPTPSKEGSPR